MIINNILKSKYSFIYPLSNALSEVRLRKQQFQQGCPWPHRPALTGGSWGVTKLGPLCVEFACSPVCIYNICQISLWLSQVDRSRKKLPLPPPEGEDGEGGGLINVIAMYDFIAKEDTDLTLKQVHTHSQTHTHIHKPSRRCVVMVCVCVCVCFCFCFCFSAYVGSKNWIFTHGVGSDNLCGDKILNPTI